MPTPEEYRRAAQLHIGDYGSLGMVGNAFGEVKPLDMLLGGLQSLGTWVTGSGSEDSTISKKQDKTPETTSEKKP